MADPTSPGKVIAVVGIKHEPIEVARIEEMIYADHAPLRVAHT